MFFTLITRIFFQSYTNDNSISNFSVYENKNATEIVTEFTKNPPETRKGSFFMDSSEAESAGKHSNVIIICLC